MAVRTFLEKCVRFVTRIFDSHPRASFVIAALLLGHGLLYLLIWFGKAQGFPLRTYSDIVSAG